MTCEEKCVMYDNRKRKHWSTSGFAWLAAKSDIHVKKDSTVCLVIQIWYSSLWIIRKQHNQRNSLERISVAVIQKLSAMVNRRGVFSCELSPDLLCIFGHSTTCGNSSFDTNLMSQSLSYTFWTPKNGLKFSVIFFYFSFLFEIVERHYKNIFYAIEN